MWSLLGLKDMHWILQAEDAHGTSNPVPLHAPAQASQGHPAEGQSAEPHTSLLQNNETLLFCLTGADKLSSNLRGTISPGQMAKLAFQFLLAHPKVYILRYFRSPLLCSWVDFTHSVNL